MQSKFLKEKNLGIPTVSLYNVESTSSNLKYLENSGLCRAGRRHAQIFITESFSPSVKKAVF